MARKKQEKLEICPSLEYSEFYKDLGEDQFPDSGNVIYFCKLTEKECIGVNRYQGSCSSTGCFDVVSYIEEKARACCPTRKQMIGGLETKVQSQ